MLTEGKNKGVRWGVHQVREGLGLLLESRPEEWFGTACI